MKAILNDNNVRGHVHVLLSILELPEWNELWSNLQLPLLSFSDLGLSEDASDAAIWHACQAQQVVLLSANRNADGADSLESTIRTHNTPASLPVLTIGDPRRIHVDKAYAREVAVRLLDYLMNIDRLLGTGRLYLP